MPPILRSVLAVIAGFVVMSLVIGLLTALTAPPLHIQPAHPTPTYLIINVLYSFLAALAGGFICGVIAPSRPVRHGAILAGIMLLMGTLSLLRFRGTQPLWYQLLLVAVPPALAIAGAAVSARSAPRLPA